MHSGKAESVTVSVTNKKAYETILLSLHRGTKTVLLANQSSKILNNNNNNKNWTLVSVSLH